ncbi:helix-hairpin-helix domain-containing protein [Ulvibacterium sp.]|uniref:ComEA family DNA-binding protein n=1 Tax=Ulvibacterium sp. TaxID=2665914 RepID=UPI00262D6D9E|nr:helix-hairpin-helix domain-containing protein [Ulvibacterium sp.]
MKDFKSLFKFNKRERSGIFFLLLIILILQTGYVVLQYFPRSNSKSTFSEDTTLQAKIDSLKQKVPQKDSLKIYPFNPNFISDYKGYALGMSTDEIDRLHVFRRQNQYVNSPEEFQKITLISDSLMAQISPYFKFPEWVGKTSGKLVAGNEAIKNSKDDKKDIEIKDLNKASIKELQSIRGIGDKLSRRIVKFRDRLGGFLVNEQLYDVYGLERHVAKTALKSFRVIEKPDIQKININTASLEEMVQLVYLRRKIALRIVEYRNRNGGISSFDELSKIEDFPSDKIDRIKLYLTL